jgi:hypothetical protein
MRKHLTPKVMIATALAAIGLAVASPARADERLTANVPFEFIVGHVRLPAGNYVISETSTSGVLVVQSADRRHNVLVLTNGDSGKAPAQPELVFKRFEGDNFLFRVTDGYAIEREIPLTPGRMERERQVAETIVRVPLMAMAH